MTRNTYWMLLLTLMFGLGLTACSEEADDDDSAVGDDDDDATADDDDDDDDDDTTAGDDDDTVGAEEDQIIGNDYHVDLTTATFTEPPGVGSIIGAYLGEIHMAFHVTALDGGAGTGELYGAVVTPDGGAYIQDLCLGTQDLSGSAAWSPPFIETTTETMVLAVEGNECTVSNMVTTYAFVGEGQALAAGTLTGELDTRCLDETVDPGAPEGATCEMLASLGVKCVDCTDGAGTFCLGLVAEGISGDLAEISGSDPETGEGTSGLQEVTEETLAEWVAGGYCS